MLAAAVVALALLVPLLVRRSRRQRWHDELAAATAEVAWFARTLLPQLRASGSPEALAGAWSVSAPRVMAVEDALTALDPTAPDDLARGHARTLREAVRSGREQLQLATAAGSAVAAGPVLDEVGERLEAALAQPVPS